MSIALCLAAVATVFAAISTAHAQTANYPSRPVRLVVPFAAGGTNDILGRIVADKFSERLGQPFIADNRGGANTMLGSEIVARATPDGHTLLIVSASIAVNPSLVRKLPYDTERDFAPVGAVASGPYLMVIHPAVPAKSVSEFIAWAKSQQGKVNYASTGTGGPPHLAAELIPLTTEEEGVALAVGACLGGERAVLLLQSSGTGNCINMLGMIIECRVPLLLLVTMRGTWAEFNPWQIPMAEATAPVLAAIGCVVKKVDNVDQVGPTVSAACQLAFNTNRPVAVLMDQRVVGVKEFK